MPGIDSMAGQSSSEVDVTKRAADNGNSSTENTEQPPSKKARVDMPSDNDEQVVVPERDRGIAPIKAEYDTCS